MQKFTTKSMTYHMFLFDESRFRHLSLLRTEGREDYDMSGNMSSKALGGKLPAVVL